MVATCTVKNPMWPPTSIAVLGVEAVTSLLRGHPPVLLGESVELFTVPVPRTLAGRPLRDSGIGSRTALSVVALQQEERIVTPMTSETVLPAEAKLLMLGCLEQRREFEDIYSQED